MVGLLGLTLHFWPQLPHLQIRRKEWGRRNLVSGHGGLGSALGRKRWGQAATPMGLPCPSTADLRRWRVLHGHHVHLVGPGLSHLSELCPQLARRSLSCS